YLSIETSSDLTISRDTMKLFPKLRSLHIYQDAKLEKHLMISPNEFENTPNLTKLQLENLILSRNTIESIQSAKRVETLEIINGGLQNLNKSMFSEMSELNFLKMTNNKISYIESGLFDNLTRLSYIDLSENNIKSIPDGLFRNNVIATGCILSK